MNPAWIRPFVLVCIFGAVVLVAEVLVHWFASSRAGEKAINLRLKMIGRGHSPSPRTRRTARSRESSVATISAETTRSALLPLWNTAEMAAFFALTLTTRTPMLLRSVSYRHETLDALVSRAVIGGTQGVMQVAITAPQNQPRRNHEQDKQDHQQ